MDERINFRAYHDDQLDDYCKVETLVLDIEKVKRKAVREFSKNIYSKAIRLAHDNLQAVGDNNEFYVTLEDLERILTKCEAEYEDTKEEND